ncbi:MAG TPA: hypothetical protein DG761_09360 [Gammaproteobacteria bacterium]|nr:hypothetical protein [Gammaproteobacteria bacterium]
MKVATKTQMNNMIRRGLFGNHFPWLSYLDWAASAKDPQHLHSMRFGVQLGAPWLYRVPVWEVYAYASQNPFGVAPADISVVSMPAGLIPRINGELQRSEHGLELHYSTHPAVMRVALALDPQDVHRIAAIAILRHFLDPASYDAVTELFDTYPDAVVEFTTYNQDVGVIPHRNTVVWEVRDY